MWIFLIRYKQGNIEELRFCRRVKKSLCKYSPLVRVMTFHLNALDKFLAVLRVRTKS